MHGECNTITITWMQCACKEIQYLQPLESLKLLGSFTTAEKSSCTEKRIDFNTVSYCSKLLVHQKKLIAIIFNESLTKIHIVFKVSEVNCVAVE
jgi:hypothetical protein